MTGARAAVEALERRWSDSFGRRALWVPSGRIGLFLTLRQLLPAGTEVILSPVNCDAVLSALLAAGMRPVFGPVDPASGNLDPEVVAAEVRRRRAAVLATNLYGVPDRVDLLSRAVAAVGGVLVEDACQALDSRLDGRRIGTFGRAAVFSFAKHLGRERGGAILLEDPALAGPLAHARDAALVAPSGTSRLRRAARAISLPAAVRHALGALLIRKRAPSRAGHRVVYEAGDLAAAAQAPGLDTFARWLRPDHPRHRETPSRADLAGDLAALESVAETSQARRRGALRLLGLNLTPAGVRAAAEESALWRVPLLVENRETMRGALVAAGVTVNCIYDPPLATCLPAAFGDRCGAGGSGDLMWAHNALPLDPLEADRILEVLGRPDIPVPVPVRR